MNSSVAIDSLKGHLARLKTDGALSSFAGSVFAYLDGERRRADESWIQTGLPTRQNEAWKYTSVAAITGSAIMDGHGRSDAKLLAQLEPIRAKWQLAVQPHLELVFVNGTLVRQWSQLTAVPGVSILSLNEALASRDAGLTSALQEAAAVFAKPEHHSKESPFAALNTSLLRDATVMHIAAGTVVSRPIILTYITTGAEDKSVSDNVLACAQPRMFASFGRLSEAVVIENHVGIDGQAYLSNSVTDIYLAAGARVSYGHMQRESHEAFHISSTRAWLERDSRLESLQVSLGAKLARQDLKVRLAASGAEALLDGLYLAHGTQHVDNHTSLEHAVGDTRSEQVYKGILDDEARAVFNGRVWIAPDAQRSNSSQLNNNLLLSVKAEVDTKPELEIYADDVKASHGATVGRLDDEALFYLRSRAIETNEAVKMLAQGFAQDVVIRCAREDFRQAMGAPLPAAVSAMKVKPL